MENRVSCRNITLDLIKLFSAYMVVFIHIPFSGDFGVVIKALARFAVPIFFLSSGFFAYGNSMPKIKDKIKKIFYIFIFASFIYNLSNIFSEYISGGIDGIYSYFVKFLDLQMWIELLVFNSAFSATRLWFLLALIYVYVIHLIIIKKKINIKNVLLISVSGLIINLILVEVLSIFNTNFPEHYTRNFLLTGFPFFGVGLNLKKHETSIRNIKTPFLILGILTGIVLTVVSLYFLGENVIYLGSVLISICIFILAIKYSFVKYSPLLVRFCECSLGVYIFHRPVTMVLNKAAELLNIDTMTVLFTNSLPIIVCIFTTFVALLAEIFNKKLR